MLLSTSFCDLTAKQYLKIVASWGCLICQRPAEVHHIRDGMGAAQRNDDFNILPLCEIHHRIGGRGVAFHADKKLWQFLHGTERELQDRLNAEIQKAIRYQSG